MSDQVCDDTHEIFTESSLQVLPISDRPWVQFIEPLEGHSFEGHGKKQSFDVVISTG